MKQNSSILMGLALFCLGTLVGFVLNLLQIEYKTNLSTKVILSFLYNNWWTLPLCGIGAIYIGFSYTFFDHKFNHTSEETDSMLIIKCFAIFIGFNQLCAYGASEALAERALYLLIASEVSTERAKKIQFTSSIHFLVILTGFCIVFWYWFDHTKIGFFFNFFNAFSVIVLINILRYTGFLNQSQIQFDYLQTCMSCLIFSGGVTFGNIGRLLNFNCGSSLTQNVTSSHRNLHLD
ncbi:unnamed protein product [Brachionus calyciflorus]|uniref:Uncharacterized protein n=1 Tax=Brachionus calyciflorus TaxID=104777 RepID=A0A813MWA6_9BILA|nr:unnamed protein product [Brachionus calyciflorus]